MEYKRYLPPNELKSYVRYFWSYHSLESKTSMLQIESFADRFPRLVFQDLNDFEPLQTVSNSVLPSCYISGIDTLPSTSVMHGRFSHFGISFYPHALNVLFKIDASELVNKMPDIELIVQTGLVQKLTNTNTAEERFALLSRFLMDRLPVRNKTHQLINTIIHSEKLSFDTSIATLPEKFEVSERQLERVFKSTIGISPKKYQRILRFEKALTTLSTASYSDLTAISYDLNFSDQAHFINDFKNFSGISPYEFVRNNKIGSESSSFITVPSTGN